ncbi:MAG: DapH/DapD/GlmU-related protein [Tenuifilaceae bacterium]
MKRFIVSIFGFLFFRWAYPNFDFHNYPFRKLMKFFFAQKILRINSHVPWPVHWTSEVKGYDKIQRGTETPGSTLGCYIDGRNGIEIGENVWIGPRVSIISMNHDLNDYNKYKDELPIRIGRDSLLTTNCIILPGVELGPHTVVAAGAVVTKSFLEGNQILAGNPAVVVKKLDNYSTSVSK